MIHKLVNEVWTPANLTQDFPNTSFSANLSIASLPAGYAWMHSAPAPPYGEYEKLEQLPPVMVDGQLTQQWLVTPFTPEEIEAAILQKRTGMVCGPWQLRQALRATGNYELIKTAMETADELTKEAWEYASEYKRLDPLVEGLRLALGVSHEDVDAIFVMAGGL
jgi:hypothetical protein